MALEKTFDPAAAEARIYNAWEAAGCFKAGSHVDSRNSTSTYAIMIPPPNVTGVLHMGHAFNNTLQDILVRWKRMQGFDTLWQAGTDHAGIATQMVVERELAKEGKRRTDFTRKEFLQKVWAWKEKSGGTIVSQLKRLGASCDWDRTAFTMAGAQGDTRTGHENSPNFHDAVIKVFVDMYNKGMIYRGKRLVNWDPHFETAISDLEVENIEVAGHMWHFKYPLAGGATYEYVEKDEDGNVTLREERDYISIATTRPETMLGDGAVAVHPSDERYAPIVGQLCEIPVGPKEHRRLIPIITDEYPDPDFGSGAVKITGAHDFNDYQVAKRGGIPMYRLMDMRGCMRADGADYPAEAAKAQAHANGAAFTENEVDAINLVPDEYRGLDRFDARAKVVADITAEGLAVMTTVTEDVDGEEVTQTVPYVENKPIMQPFGDRSKVVIEPMLTDQWFVDAEKVVGPAMDAVNNGQIKLLPEREKKVWDHWLENIEPWCISRQLWWGHQIPVWYTYDSKTNSFRDAFCAASWEEVKEVAASHFGPDVEICQGTETDYHLDDVIEATQWFEYSGQKGRRFVHLYRDPDVLDTWFSSGLWPIGTLGWPDWDESTSKYFPTNDLITGTDILFFWVARMVMMQLAVVGDIPFSNVYLHGLVRDAKGKKMSKSTGNVVDPLDIIDEYGADALRFSSAAMAALGGVLKLDMQRIAGYRNFGTKLWNAARFAEMNDAYGLDVSGEASAKLAVNRWIIGEVGRVRVTVDDALQGYRFNDAANALYTFVWGTVCDWYVELSKPLLQGDDAAAKDETRKVLSWVIDQCLILLHPIMPFITEELWQGDGLLAVQPWPTYGLELVDADADAEVRWTITLIENIRSARAQLNVPAGAKVPLVQVANDAAGQAALDANLALVQRLARVDAVSAADTMPKGAISVTAPGASFGLPIADLIDVDKEQARLSKNLGKLEKEIGGLNGRLNNPKFVASAPDEVVEEAKANLAARQEEAGKVKEALARLSEMG